MHSISRIEGSERRGLVFVLLTATLSVWSMVAVSVAQAAT